MPNDFESMCVKGAYTLLNFCSCVRCNVEFWIYDTKSSHLWYNYILPENHVCILVIFVRTFVYSIYVFERKNVYLHSCFHRGKLRSQFYYELQEKYFWTSVFSLQWRSMKLIFVTPHKLCLWCPCHGLWQRKDHIAVRTTVEDLLLFGRKVWEYFCHICIIWLFYAWRTPL